jgi:uncharacterized protein (TIGR03790 family)
MPCSRWRIGRVVVCIALMLLASASARALEPEEIALVINARVPAGRALADFYAHERHIPDGRIIEISLDPDSVLSPAEEMPFDRYEPLVAAPVRKFLRENHLQDRVKCLVTFWGVPLRIGRRVLTPSENGDRDAAQKDLDESRGKIVQQVETLERLAVGLNPSFSPTHGDGITRLSKRMDAALPVIVTALPSVQDPATRIAEYSQILGSTRLLLGEDRTTILMSQPAAAPLATRPVTPAELAEAQSRLAEAEKKLAQIQAGPPNTELDQSRALSRQVAGLFGLAFTASAQVNRLSVDQSESALDSELSLLWWPDYPPARWVDNVLQWQTARRIRDNHLKVPPTLMVTRLDGPSEEIVHKIIETSVKIEAEGLGGQFALDARGKTGSDPYAQFDQKIRNLADLLKRKTKLPVTLDDKESLIPPHSLHDIGLYCGWYSLRNFSSPGQFVPGAVGYHVASFELLSLRQPREHGWVRGLLSEGVVATLGPVAEPYLQSFPPPDEFFPLLLTGKLALAEVYWRTVPWSSWMQTCIGDPLYTPFKLHPQLDVEALPPGLYEPIGAPATQPATQPIRE